MNKNEIIESLAIVNVPAGAQLVRQSVPGLNVQFARIRPDDTGGLKLMMAQIFMEQLEAALEDAPDELCPALFERIHRVVRDLHQAMNQDALFETVENEVIADHRKVIERLREIAAQLHIIYKEPEDPLLE